MNEVIFEANEEPKVKIKLFGTIYEVQKILHGESMEMVSTGDPLDTVRYAHKMLVKRGISEEDLKKLTSKQVLGLVEALGGKKKETSSAMS